MRFVDDQRGSPTFTADLAGAVARAAAELSAQADILQAQALLERQSGQMDNPRILGAFNENTPDWLSFFMFTFFTDRDGKMQLAALAESGFDPLSRTCRFMLTGDGESGDQGPR